MAQVSRFPLRRKVYERIFEILFKSIAGVKKKKDVEEFFNDFLSPTERMVLAKRLAIGVLLAKDYDYGTIREVLKVSPPTIAKVKNRLKEAGDGYRKVIQKLLREEVVKEALLDLVDGVAKAGSIPSGSGSEMWRAVDRVVQRRKREKPF